MDFWISDWIFADSVRDFIRGGPLALAFRLPTELDLRNTKIYTRSFQIYSIWPQASKHTHARAQCSHANVGLAQARPNDLTLTKSQMERPGFEANG